MSKKLLFYMCFRHDEHDLKDQQQTNNPSTFLADGETLMETLGFEVMVKDPETWVYSSKISSALDQATIELEKEFGIHDSTGSDSSKYFAYGFDSYEVLEKNTAKLMESWQKVFIKLAGNKNVGPIVDLHKASIKDSGLRKVLKGSV